MKILFISIALVIALAGCASMNNTVSVPEKVNLTVNGKNLKSVASLVGQSAKITSDKTITEKDGTTARQINLQAEEMAQVAKWFVILGGAISAVGLAVIFLLKKPFEGLSGVGLGLSIVGVTLAVKALYSLIIVLAQVSLVGAFVWGAYTLYRHRKNKCKPTNS